MAGPADWAWGYEIQASASCRAFCVCVSVYHEYPSGPSWIVESGGHVAPARSPER